MKDSLMAGIANLRVSCAIVLISPYKHPILQVRYHGHCMNVEALNMRMIQSVQVGVVSRLANILSAAWIISEYLVQVFAQVVIAFWVTYSPCLLHL